MECPNCGESSVIDGLCVCGHDGNRNDCGCEFCSTPPTADMIPLRGFDIENSTMEGGLTPNEVRALRGMVPYKHS